MMSPSPVSYLIPPAPLSLKGEGGEHRSNSPSPFRERGLGGEVVVGGESA